MTKKRQITWEEFKNDTLRLAEIIQQAEYKPTLIVAISRGGFIPARILSNHLSVSRLTAIGIEYPSADRSKPNLYSVPSPLESAESVLLVEDCLDSGYCLATARGIIAPSVKEVRSCSLYRLQKTRVPIDFVVDTLNEPPFFPWE